MQRLNLLLIGCGPHAKRIYFPIIEKISKSLAVKIVCIVERAERAKDLNLFLRQSRYQPNTIFLAPEEQRYDTLLPITEERLMAEVRRHKITGVIIATEPLTHKVYAHWAIRNKLNILMDKPITTRVNASVDRNEALGIASDYYDLANELAVARHDNPLLVFNIMAQRRYHPAFLLIRQLINEVSLRTNCPVTSIQSFHGDGQWRTPSELVDIDYHSFNRGYGKCSHSGYHTIDVANWLIKSAQTSPNKRPDSVDVFANFTRPTDFLAQITTSDYRHLFAGDDKHQRYSKSVIMKRISNYGEIDAFASLAFKAQGRIITLASLNMVHNSFSQRYRSHSDGQDLYKGNGRVRHESHYISQGPFQSISFISYQGREINNKIKNQYGFGQEYHLDIHVFRNDKLFPDWQNYTEYTMKDLARPILTGYSRGHQEDARLNCIVEFIYQIQGKIAKSLSPFEDHQQSVELMSAIYQSAAQRKLANQNPLISLELTNEK